ncbi:Cytochrome c-552 [bioreactor metagenome]|uniref:nitrite reductase (cytochrome; ammonia-forming) n=1 Tax=bioreactor metagenome TaxID=1076179 RepID=A0A644TLS7_9ZZZZ|nr:ammonia-forming cytochrome c nitrite reductase subunit c552 [Negativicutes bacterium]
MSRMQKFLAVFAGLLVVFFGFVVVRVWAVKPPAAIQHTVISAGQYDPAVWGKAYPLQYKSYQKNLEMAASPTGYNGSENYQKAERQPELTVNFKGNPFSKDYTEDRGHLYALEDLQHSKRIGPTSKGACITCKTPHLEEFYNEMGWGFANKPLTELQERSKHPVSCANCHDPETMNLRVINPAFVEAMSRKGVDVTKATREEMRSYVCGQCHAEYYFAPGTTQVVFPWDKGYSPEEMYQYYADKPNGFEQDFVHPDSGVKVLKAQHPDFEEWANGTHGKFGVSCADCHMPFMRESGKKYSSHWMTSPLRTMEQACYPCHVQAQDQLYNQVKATQDNTWQMQRRAGELVARAHGAVQKAANMPDVNQTELANARELLRRAQWYWDFVAAANGGGFHNGIQTLHTLGQSADFANQAIEAANRAAGVNTL